MLVHETHGNENPKFFAKRLLRDWNQSTYAQGTEGRKNKFPSFLARPFSSESLVHLGPRQGLTL